jgi:threonine/homoserine/homoserine lactone efflux protein
MNVNLLIPFLIGMIILAVTPGPGVFASMAKAIAEGFKTSLFFIGGLAVGDIIFMLLALCGLSAIAKVSGELFLGIRIVGGLYLIYLGIKIFGSAKDHLMTESKHDDNRFQTFFGGLLVTTGNPKPILFYASILPTIININEVKVLDILFMVILLLLVTFSVVGTYSYIASLSNKIFLKKGWQKKINQAAGLVMIIVGVTVLVQ